MPQGRHDDAAQAYCDAGAPEAAACLNAGLGRAADAGRIGAPHGLDLNRLRLDGPQPGPLRADSAAGGPHEDTEWEEAAEASLKACASPTQPCFASCQNPS